MKTFLNYSRITICAFALIILHSCGNDDEAAEITIESNTITDFVANNDDYSSLNAALQKTGLDIVLAGEGDFTVFAPNNAAFDIFLNGTALEDVENNVLVPILLNHVLNTSIAASSFETGYQKNLATEASTGSNLDLFIDTSNGVILNGQAAVTTSDITTDNGIIHAVNTVIELPTLDTFLSLDPQLASSYEALTDEGNTTFSTLFSDLNEDITVFAPNNEAIADLLDGGTIADIDNDVLARVLSNHILSGIVGTSSCLLYTSSSPRDRQKSRMPSSA